MSKESYTLIGAIIASLISLVIAIFSANDKHRKDRINFKKEHHYNQLIKLYLTLYGVIVQSEYIRYFINEYEKTNHAFWKVPFLEIKRNRSLLKDGKVKREEIEDEITKFDKGYLAETVISNKEYASQRLLKLAVAYRYCHDKYLLNFNNKALQEAMEKEEIKLLYLMVKTIIKETNVYLKECELPFDTMEISSGVMSRSIYKEDKEYF